MKIGVDGTSPLGRLQRAARTEVNIYNSWGPQLAYEASQSSWFPVDSVRLALRINSALILLLIKEINSAGTDPEKTEVQLLLADLKKFHQTGEIPPPLKPDIFVAGRVHRAIMDLAGIKSAELEW